MSNAQRDHSAEEKAIPPPPPPPPPVNSTTPLVMKLRIAPPGRFFRPPPPPRTDSCIAPTGYYFFYGTLADPSMLCEILRLDSEPEFRPAYLLGYECKLWGQYPALLDAHTPQSRVEGFVYYVQTEEHGAKLAAYETNNYRADPCRIHYTDGNEPTQSPGYTFKFIGNPLDLSEGKFDLGTWLRRMGRHSAAEKLESRGKSLQ